MSWPERFDICDPVTGTVWMTRWRLVSRDRWGLFVHHMRREDWSRDPHNHPWEWFRSWRLLGTYDEVRYVLTEPVWAPGKLVLVGCGERRSERASLVGAHEYHRVTRLHRRRGVWSLVLRGERLASWGFWAGVEHVDHVAYFARERARCGLG